VKFSFIRRQLPGLPLRTLCRVLGVSRSGYYAWLGRPPSPRALDRAVLAARIAAVHRQFKGAYGSPRVHGELRRQGVKACRNTVAKVMRAGGLHARPARRFRPRTTDADHPFAPAPNLLAQRFTADRPDRVWIGDITYIPSGAGFVYLACVMDLCSRRIVGWSMADHLRAELTVRSLRAALAGRRPGAGLIFHSDRGVQYACAEFRRLIARHGIRQSMSGAGNCYDSAPIESFWGKLKTESLHHRTFRNHDEARAAVFDYIEVFYNRRRSHSSIGFVSPEQFEASLST
jgi:putative transposase